MAWNKGPLPPDTWFWGGVSLVGDKGMIGFHFASFHGDHAILSHDLRWVKADEIKWWDNSLVLPFPEPTLPDVPEPVAEKVNWREFL